MNQGNLLVVGHLAVNETGDGGKRHRFFGGAAYQVAQVAGLCLPGQVSLVSVCGQDFDLSLLQRVDVKGVKILRDQDSDRFVVRERRSGERSFKVIGDLWKKVNLKNIDFENVTWVHLATASPEQQLEWLRELKRAGKRIKVSADTFELFVREQREKVEDVFSKCDLVFANKEEWSGLRKKPNCPAIVKMGRNGAGLWHKDSFVFMVPAKKVRVKDTTGAGEVVAGMFLGLTLSGMTRKEALARSCQVASLSVMEHGVSNAVSKIKQRLPKNSL